MLNVGLGLGEEAVNSGDANLAESIVSIMYRFASNSRALVIP